MLREKSAKIMNNVVERNRKTEKVSTFKSREREKKEGNAC